MKSFSAFSIKTLLVLLIIQVQLISQNVGIGTNTPTSKLHLKSTVQSVTALDIDYETGIIDGENTSGDYNWYITSADGFNSAKSAKMPLLYLTNEKAILLYGFNMDLAKEVTISFDFKNVDPDDEVQFIIDSDHFEYTPPITSGWKQYTTTFVSQSSYDVIRFSVKANEDDAFPAIQIDNVLITYPNGHVLKIEDGTEGEGKFLQSDALGHTEWVDFESEVDQKIEDNMQSLSFHSGLNELSISDGNTVRISGLKTITGKFLELSGSQILGSPGTSFYLPKVNSTGSSLQYTASDGSYYWGKDPINGVSKGDYSTRWGWENTAPNFLATAFGSNNKARNTGVTVWGEDNDGVGLYSSVWGSTNTVNSAFSTVFGKDNVNFSSSTNSTSWGENNVNKSEKGKIFGSNNLINAELSTCWGDSNVVQGDNATTWGKNNINNSLRGTTWGLQNVVTGDNNTSWGDSNYVEGIGNTIWGRENIATPDSEHSTVLGYYNLAKGNYSFVTGFHNEALSIGEVAIGRYNYSTPSLFTNSWQDDNFIFSVGNGTGDLDRNNAFSVGKNGNVAINKNSTVHDLHVFDENFLSVELESETDEVRLRLSSSEQSEIILGTGNTFDIEYDVIANCFSLDNKIRIDGSNIGINKINPSFDLHLGSDDAAKPGTSSWTVSSDRRLKKDINQFTDGLDIISAIEPVWFTYNGLADIPEETYVGTIAQDLEEIAPYMVSEFTHRDDQGNSENYKAVNYGAMDFVLINAIKEQQLEIESLKAQNTTLKDQFLEIKAQISEIKSFLGSEKNVAPNSDIK